jgi:hypothetical protein
VACAYRKRVQLNVEDASERDFGLFGYRCGDFLKHQKVLRKDGVVRSDRHLSRQKFGTLFQLGAEVTVSLQQGIAQPDKGEQHEWEHGQPQQPPAQAATHEFVNALDFVLGPAGHVGFTPL